MPGLSFLFKKSWHTMRTDNVKQLYVNEQKIEKERLKEEETRREVEKVILSSRL